MIMSNQAKCLICGEEPYSATRHNLTECSCGNVIVDGGMSYIRHGWKAKADYKNISIEWDDELVSQVCNEIETAQMTGRNPLGIACAVARAIRDSGYKVVKEEEECNLET